MQGRDNPDELIFECFAEGRRFRFYASGRTDGFEGGVQIINHFIPLCSRLLQEGADLSCLGVRTPSLPLQPTGQETAAPLQG